MRPSHHLTSAGMTFDTCLAHISSCPGKAEHSMEGDRGCALWGGASAEEADVLWKWNASTQSYETSYLVARWGEPYDGRWWDDETGALSVMRFAVGECFWVSRRSQTAASP